MNNEIIELFTKFIENRQNLEESQRVIELLKLGENMEEWEIVIANMDDTQVIEDALTAGMTQKIFNKISERIKRRNIKNLS